MSEELLAAHPDIYLTFGSKRISVQPGWHFGSRYPGDPARLAVYDFLPKTLLGHVANVAHFHANHVFDKWVGNSDGRQAFFTARWCAVNVIHASKTSRDCCAYDRPRLRV